MFRSVLSISSEGLSSVLPALRVVQEIIRIWQRRSISFLRKVGKGTPTALFGFTLVLLSLVVDERIARADWHDSFCKFYN